MLINSGLIDGSVVEDRGLVLKGWLLMGSDIELNHVIMANHALAEINRVDDDCYNTSIIILGDDCQEQGLKSVTNGV